ncbi:hypothetical protein C1Y63_00515 [Corynebacterium sp. 13CS0277]|uniref:HAD family hydrolase n=1 Tax=Corynebacterium sp. 13CS0277 TaxID=2071994 RepID=UPI000D037667|nr:HAD family hydrolase [Corynebacterium sp. 13CS0277]PRQ12578.1 hypothetical protein C1Y63_00515 [Corynebacterium sp. 13CS0277]
MTSSAPLPLAGHFLASDMDGTLIFDGKVSERDLAAIAAYRRAGGTFALSTGRSLNLTRDVVVEYGMEIDYAVMCSGAVVSDGAFEPFYVKEIPTAVVDDIVDFVSGWPDIAVCATFLDTRDAVLLRQVELDHRTELFELFGPVGSAGKVADHVVTVVPIWLPESDLRPRPAGYDIATAQRLLEEHLGDEVDIHRNAEFLDIAPSGCTKATGLARAVAEWGRTPSATHTLGDNFNDLPMHEWATHSVSFPHSPAPVRQATEVVAGSVAEYIEGLLASVGAES